MSALTKLFLFGGDLFWNPSDWTDSDDRVRGGSSYSELSCSPTDPVAEFRGNLDIKTLGGAGFASQRTVGENRSWDLSKYEGIVLDVKECDKKRYTLTLKDELLPKSPNGREQSTISWEYDFQPTKDEKVYITWNDFKPTYRGREKSDTEPLNLRDIKRISLMMRSFFGTQEGDFSLSIRSISAFKKVDIETCAPYHDDPNSPYTENFHTSLGKNSQQGWLSQTFGCCIGS